MTFNLSKRIRLSSILIIICILILAVFITVFAKSYFSESVFYVNQHKYKQANEQVNIVNYTTGTAPSIEVHIYDQDRKVLINKEEYSIYRKKSDINTSYEVIYPNGHKYEVVQSGFLMSYDGNGEFYPEISMYTGNQRVFQAGEEEYFPSSIVIAAYPEYHSKQGSLVLFSISFILLIYGWCGYRYQKFQNFMFIISFYWIWVNDAEPSDFYYFMCKVGGVLTMIGSVVLVIKSILIQ